MRSVLLLGLLSCISIACATATDTPEDGLGGGNTGGADPGTGGATPGSGGGVFGTGGLGMGGVGTGGTSSGGAATGGAATGGAATGGASTGGTGTGGTTLTCEDAVDWVANQHSVNYPPGQLFNYEGAVYRYDGMEPMTYVNGDCPPDQSGEPWCQSGQYPFSAVTDC